jgi:amino acid permease
VDAVLKWRPGRRGASRGGGDHGEGGEISDARFAFITTVIIVLSYVVAMTVHSLEAVLAYVGSTGSTSISFILPGLFYYKISDPDSPHRQRLLKSDDEYDSDDSDGDSVAVSSSRRSSVRSGGSGKKQWREALLRRGSLALAVYGFLVMTVCLTMNIFFHASH